MFVLNMEEENWNVDRVGAPVKHHINYSYSRSGCSEGIHKGVMSVDMSHVKPLNTDCSLKSLKRTRKSVL